LRVLLLCSCGRAGRLQWERQCRVSRVWLMVRASFSFVPERLKTARRQLETLLYQRGSQVGGSAAYSPAILMRAQQFAAHLMRSLIYHTSSRGDNARASDINNIR